MSDCSFCDGTGNEEVDFCPECFGEGVIGGANCPNCAFHPDGPHEVPCRNCSYDENYKEAYDKM